MTETSHPDDEMMTTVAGECSNNHHALESTSSHNNDEQQQQKQQQEQHLRRPITVLPQHVVDQIAAGEVVQRPVSVVKELLENSLDAGATHIVIHVEGGGLSKLSISDNGCGINKSDLHLLATRHATSKLVTVEDLASIASFGFRGEALSSTSMVSRLVTVTTRTTDSDVAYTMSYQNGKPMTTQQQQEEQPSYDEPKPCARTIGTTIVVHDLFYNVVHRQKAYSKRESEEYAKILTLVQMYAIHYPTVGFVCQRTTSSSKKTSSDPKRGTGAMPTVASNKRKHTSSSSSSPSIVVDCNTSQIQAVKTVLQSRERLSKRQRTIATTTMIGSENELPPIDDTSKEQLIEATKQVISHVLEANISQHLLYMESSSASSESLPSSTSKHKADGNGKPSSTQSATSPIAASTVTTTMPSASSFVFQYTAGVYFSSPSYNISTTAKQQKGGTTTTNSSGQYSYNKGITNNKFVLFLNHRLVDLPPLKRALEDVYANFGGGGNGSASSIARAKPVLVVDIQVPGTQVDVNVHPSKRQVALMFQEDLINAITHQLRQRLEEHGQSFVLLQKETTNVTSATKTMRHNPYTKTTVGLTKAEDTTTANKKRETTTSISRQQDDVENDESNDDDDDEEESSLNQNQKGRTSYSSPQLGDDASTASKRNSRISNNTTNNSTNTKGSKPIPPSQFVRTNSAAPAGAIEPFLVFTQTQSQKYQEDLQLSQSSAQNHDDVSVMPEETIEPSSASASPQEMKHETDTSSKPPSSLWPASIDMSQPGAFAQVLMQQESTDIPLPQDSIRRSTIVKQPIIVRPKRVIPTECSYSSVISLRKRIHKQQCSETTAQLRKAFFLGVVSHQRSLLQCGEELVMINHMELSKELFYQLALARFGTGKASVAQLGGSDAGGKSGGGIHIHTAIAQALQWEDDLIQKEGKGETIESILSQQQQRYKDNADDHTAPSLLLEVNETNYNLAQQATACLLESADMLSEYFSICIGKQQIATDVNDDRRKTRPLATKLTHEDNKDAQAHDDDDDDDDDDDNSAKDVLDAVLTGLPVLLEGHCPQPHGLPIFLLRLATQVDWTEERPCFHGICKELANFYAMVPLSTVGEEGGSDGSTTSVHTSQQREDSTTYSGPKKDTTAPSLSSLNSHVQHGLFPALSYLLLPSKHLTENGHYSSMTKLSTLYKVFERC